MNFWKNCNNWGLFRIVQGDNYGHLKVFPDSQDHLAEVQPQRHSGVGQEQGHARGLIFFGNVAITGVGKFDYIVLKNKASFTSEIVLIRLQHSFNIHLVLSTIKLK